MNQFLERYKEILGDEFEGLEFAKELQAIRINNLKISDDELIKKLKAEGIEIEKIPYLDFGYWVKKAKFSPGASSEYLQGYYYIQEAAAQVPAQVLAPKQSDLVLDMAAAPGGKTTHIAQYMKNEGRIIAIDTNPARIGSLKNNIERLGLKNVLVYVDDARKISNYELKFDKILLDAPCSGNFVDDKEWFGKKTLEGIKERAELQKELLAAAINAANKGATIVYSTCSLEPEENEYVIDWALGKFHNIKLEEIKLPIGDEGLTHFKRKLNPEIKKCRRFWPHKTKTQGFFIAKIKIQ